MVKIAQLFRDRFDTSMQTDLGVSVCCSECDATFKIPSVMNAPRRGDMESDYTDEIMDFVERLLEHLDECQPIADASTS
jgi:hypothetical protein